MEKVWKRIEPGLYQRYDDGIPQNVYIDRHMDGSKYIGWMYCYKLDGKLGASGLWWHTLRAAKESLMDAKGVE